MLNSLKNMAGSRNRHAQDEADQLQSLITTARQEREAANAMLTNLIARSVRMAPLSKAIDETDERTTAVAERLEKVADRLGAIESRVQQLASLDERLTKLTQKTTAAEQAIEQLVGPDGALATERNTFSKLVAEARETRTALDVLTKERPSIDALRVQLKTTDEGIKQSTEQANAIKWEVDQVRVLATTLKKDYGTIGQTAKEAREDCQTALKAAEAAEAKSLPLVQLRDMMINVDERLAALNALSEHVTRKLKTIEGQQQAVEHAVLQANRVNELAWEMETKTATIAEGVRQASEAEEAVARVEGFIRQAAARLSDVTKIKDDVEAQINGLNQGSSQTLATIRTELALLDGRKKEFETFEVRMRTLQSLVGDAEARMTALAEKNTVLATLGPKIENLSQCFETLYAQADDLVKQQLALEPLRDQLATVNGLAKKAAWQMDALRQSHQDLDVLRNEIQQFYVSHAEVAKLVDKLQSDRRSLDGLSERLTNFQNQTPKIEARAEEVLAKLANIASGAAKADTLSTTVAEIDSRLTQLNERVPFVEKLEERLNGLNVLSASVDRRIEEQLARQAEVDRIRTNCNGLTEQVNDAQHKLDAVRRLSHSLTPLSSDVTKLQADLTAINERLASVQFTEASVNELEKRYASLVTASREAGDEVAERARQMKALADELARTTTIKDQLLKELDQAQSRQRETVAYIRASEDQVKRAESMSKQFDQSASQLAFGERKLAAVETRLAEVRRLSEDAQQSVAVLQSREQIILAVKAEVENIHGISARTREDLTRVLEQSNQLAELRGQVETLVAKIAATNEQIDTIDERRKKVDEVESKVNGITHLLDDVRINLETLSEQKVVVDHVSGQLEATLLEARNTVRALQQERELAQRIEKGVRQLRGRVA